MESEARPWIATLAALALFALAAMAAARGSAVRGPLLALTGGALGFTLFRSSFGFAGSFRALIERGDATGFRAQALALALCTVVFFPLLAMGQLLGQPLDGFASPIGVAFVVGGVLFGIGMQIGGGCASGTLFLLGGGDLKLLVTLAFFVVGSAVGAATLDVWQDLPAWPATTTQDLVGWPAALLLHLLVFAAVMAWAPRGAVDRQGVVDRRDSRGWSLAFGATMLAGLNGLTLVLAGRPWGETSGFTLWGGKIAGLLGFEPWAWPYFRSDPSALSASVFADVTSLMDIGIVAGAVLAAALDGRFAWTWRLSPGSVTGAACGGLLMGYGARLSNGCNIGAYFSALASGSVSGWVWPVAALAGSVVGLRLRKALDRP